MKLVMCKECEDVFKLDYEKRYCKCGKAWGYYKEDGLNAVYGGWTAIPLGVLNSSLYAATLAQPKEGHGKRFEAFVIPIHCPTMTYKLNDEED